METTVLRRHFDYLIQCTERLQLSERVFSRYSNHYEEIFLYCCENHLTLFTYQDAADYCGVKCPVRKEYAAKETTKIAYTVARYFEDGRFTWKTTTFSQYPVCSAYEKLMDKFRQKLLGKLCPGTVRVGMVIIRQFLCFLEQSGTTDAAHITTENILDFVRQESPNHKGSMPKLLRTMRKFVCFLRSEAIVDLNADRFLKNAGRCRQKTLPCFTEEELRRTFQQIDRTTDKGRRDYTIYIADSNRHKDRCIAVKHPVMEMCKKYDAIARSLYPDTNMFFPNRNQKEHSAEGIQRFFHKCWKMAGNPDGLEYCTPYILRHNFAARRITEWMEEGKDFSQYMPYLSAYMGHQTFRETCCYLHLMPERLSWMGFMDISDIVLEVEHEK